MKIEWFNRMKMDSFITEHDRIKNISMALYISPPPPHKELLCIIMTLEDFIPLFQYIDCQISHVALSVRLLFQERQLLIL